MVKLAPGGPGIEARWTSSAKDGVGTVPTSTSAVWFTISHGILNEIYYPRVDQACTRDMGFIITDGQSLLWEEKRDLDTQVDYAQRGVPAFILTNTAKDGSFRIVKRIITDPMRNVVLQHIKFEDLKPTLGRNYYLYAIAAPHLVNRGANNTGWVGDFKGKQMLFAQGGISAMAMAASAPWSAASVGFAGASDAWRDLQDNKRLTQAYDRAEDGTIALTGEIDLAVAGNEFVLALGFGRLPEEAAHATKSALHDKFDMAFDAYCANWREWHDKLLDLDRTKRSETIDPYRISAAMLRTHEATAFAGGYIASLAIPWGFSKGDDDLGGYHLVWPRDLCETAGALIAMGAATEARNVLLYLQTVQEEDGHWPQNMWLDGSSYWPGIQMDEVAFPLLLIDLARRNKVLRDGDVQDFCTMVLRAVSYIVKNGPVTGQDRWEEDAGYTPFTLGVEIAGLLAAADHLDLCGQPQEAAYARDTADSWYEQIDRWIYAKDTELAHRLGLKGYYVRITPVETSDAASPIDGFVAIKNRPVSGNNNLLATQVISPDALALVRFGLRDPHDPRIRDTISVIDHLLKVDLPQGPCWHRYNDDGYGEHEDGSPFNGTGIGRAWPLLTGERAHYELQRGHEKEAKRLLAMLEACTSKGHMLPEQLWDSHDIPERELFFGKPAGSAMPLVWAHGEHIKLLRSLRDGKVFDLPPQPVERYLKKKTQAAFCSWRFNNKPRTTRQGRKLRIEALAPMRVHWGVDKGEWQDTQSNTTALGVHFADLDTSNLPAGAQIKFTFFWPETHKWEGKDYGVVVV